MPGFRGILTYSIPVVTVLFGFIWFFGRKKTPKPKLLAHDKTTSSSESEETTTESKKTSGPSVNCNNKINESPAFGRKRKACEISRSDNADVSDGADSVEEEIEKDEKMFPVMSSSVSSHLPCMESEVACDTVESTKPKLTELEVKQDYTSHCAKPTEGEIERVEKIIPVLSQPIAVINPETITTVLEQNTDEKNNASYNEETSEEKETSKSSVVFNEIIFPVTSYPVSSDKPESTLCLSQQELENDESELGIENEGIISKDMSLLCEEKTSLLNEAFLASTISEQSIVGEKDRNLKVEDLSLSTSVIEPLLESTVIDNTQSHIKLEQNESPSEEKSPNKIIPTTEKDNSLNEKQKDNSLNEKPILDIKKVTLDDKQEKPLIKDSEHSNDNETKKSKSAVKHIDVKKSPALSNKLSNDLSKSSELKNHSKLDKSVPSKLESNHKNIVSNLRESPSKMIHSTGRKENSPKKVSHSPGEESPKTVKNNSGRSDESPKTKVHGSGQSDDVAKRVSHSSGGSDKSSKSVGHSLSGDRHSSGGSDKSPKRVGHSLSGDHDASKRVSHSSGGSDTYQNNGNHDWSSFTCDSASESSYDSGKGTSVGEFPTPNTSPQTQQVYNCNFPTAICGRLIGRQGKNINFIKEKSGANITLNANPFTPDFQLCIIEGTEKQIESALKHIGRKFPEVDLSPINIPSNDNSSAPVLMPEIMQLNLPEGISVDVVVSSIVDAGHIFIQQPTHPSFPSLERLNQFMIACYVQDGLVPQLPRPLEVGVICAAPMLNGWYRAQISAVYEDTDECDVKYVDYGGFARVQGSLLRQIRSDFMTLPFQACECYMANITPLQEEEFFSAEAAGNLEELTQGKMLQAQVVGRSQEGIPYVHVYQINGEKVIFVNREMVNRGFTRWIEVLS